MLVVKITNLELNDDLALKYKSRVGLFIKDVSFDQVNFADDDLTSRMSSDRWLI